MRRRSVVAALAVVSCWSAMVAPATAVVGGQDAAARSYWVLLRAGDTLCSGTLVATRWVLTAAHCVAEGGTVEVMGGSNLRSELLDGSGVAWKALGAGYTHPLWDPGAATYDFGLVRLDAALPLGIAPLPSKDVVTYDDSAYYEPGTSAALFGFGADDPAGANFPPALQFGVMYVQPRDACAATYGGGTYPSSVLLCTWLPPRPPASEVTSCNGDSGGPLLGSIDGRQLLIGVHSFHAAASCTGPAFQGRVQVALAWMKMMIATDAQVGGVRVWGPNRYATARAMTDVFAPGGTVLVVTGENFPDALAAGPVAGAVGGPILLVGRDEVPVETADALARLQPGRVIVLGGPAAVDGVVLDDLANRTGVVPEQWWGDTRYETAAATTAATFPGPAGRVWLASGESAADAVIASAAGALAGEAMLLVPPSGPLPGAVAAELARLAPGTIDVVGAVGDDVVAELGAFGVVVRHDGPTASDRSLAVAQVLTGSTATVLMATAENWPDALTGGALAARLGAPLVLAPGVCVPPSTRAALDAWGAGLVVLLGGPVALSAAVDSLTTC